MADIVEVFCREAMLSLEDLLDKSGSVLYSSFETMRPGEFYLLGLNPGGDPVNHEKDTIRRHLGTLPGNTNNAYTDEYWGPYQEGPEGDAPLKKGDAPLQIRLRYLFDKLGFDIRNHCCPVKN